MIMSVEISLLLLEWIKCCISSARFLVLVNENPIVFLQGLKGLRQEDPFSFYLFVLAMDVLVAF